MSTPLSCKDDASKSSDDSVCEIDDMLHDITSTVNEDIVSVCNCGKKGSDNDMNSCNKCKQVKYCNAACKKKHRHKHKKACERRVAELHDEKLFNESPPEEDCPICFIRMPSLDTGSQYMTCCGKIICNGCLYAPVYDNQGNKLDHDKQNQCPFCRVVAPKTDAEANKRDQKRFEAGDAIAIYNLGVYYREGKYAYPQNLTKALELYHRAAELGLSKAYGNIGYAYTHGLGVEVDKEKGSYYYEVAAMRGSVTARENLGNDELLAGNMDRAFRHHLIAVSSGSTDSLNMIKELYSKGLATRECYTKALQSYQTYLGEIKSPQRDKAATLSDQLRYY